MACSREEGGEEVRVNLCFCCFFKLLNLKIFSILRCHILGGVCLCLCAQSWPILCDPMDYSLPGFSVHVISQARILEGIAISFSRGSSQPRNWTRISCIGRQILYYWATRQTYFVWLAFQYWKKVWKILSIFWLCLNKLKQHKLALAYYAAAAKTLCDPIDGSPPGSPVPGIL